MQIDTIWCTGEIIFALANGVCLLSFVPSHSRYSMLPGIIKSILFGRGGGGRMLPKQHVCSHLQDIRYQHKHNEHKLRITCLVHTMVPFENFFNFKLEIAFTRPPSFAQDKTHCSVIDIHSLCPHNSFPTLPLQVKNPVLIPHS